MFTSLIFLLLILRASQLHGKSPDMRCQNSCLLRNIGSFYIGGDKTLHMGADLRQPISILSGIEKGLEKASGHAKKYIPEEFVNDSMKNDIEYSIANGVRKDAAFLCKKAGYTLFRPRNTVDLNYGLELLSANETEASPIDVNRDAHSVYSGEKYFGGYEGSGGGDSEISAFNDRPPLVDLDGKYHAGTAAKDGDTVSILCQKPVTYAERSYGAYKRARRFKDLLISSYTTMKPLILSLRRMIDEGKKISNLTQGFELPPSTQMLELANLANYLGRESTWKSGKLDYQKIVKASELLQTALKSDLFKSFSFAISDRVESFIFNRFPGESVISNRTGRFKVKATTAAQDDFIAEGLAEFELAGKPDEVIVYEILPLVSESGKIIRNKYLAFHAAKPFVFDSLDMLTGRECDIRKKDQICDLSNLPISRSQEACARSILEGHQMAGWGGCELRDKEGIIAYRTRCTNLRHKTTFMSASSPSALVITCPNKNSVSYMIPAGVSRLQTGCEIWYKSSKLFPKDPDPSAQMSVPPAIPVKTGLVGKVRDITIGVGTGGTIVIAIIAKLCFSCITDKCGYEFISCRKGFRLRPDLVRSRSNSRRSISVSVKDDEYDEELGELNPSAPNNQEPHDSVGRR